MVPNIFAQPVGTLVRRRGIIVYPMGRRVTPRADLKQKMLTILATVIHIWSLGPQVLGFLTVLLGITLFTYPEVVLLMPLRVLGLAQAYGAYVLDRVVSRAEFEIMRVMFGSGSVSHQAPMSHEMPASSQPIGSTTPPVYAFAPAVYPAGGGNWSLLGWIAALITYINRGN